MRICIELRNNLVSEWQISDIFERYGNVSSTTVSLNRAYVFMSNKKEAWTAINALDGSDVNGKAIHVKKANRPYSNRINITHQLGLMRLL